MLFVVDPDLTLRDVTRDAFSRDNPTVYKVHGRYTVAAIQQYTRDLDELGDRNCVVVAFVHDAVVLTRDGDRAGTGCPACPVKVVCNTDSPGRILAVVARDSVGVPVEMSGHVSPAQLVHPP